jgi:hypothetical protein
VSTRGVGVCAHCDGSIPHRHDDASQIAARIRERAHGLALWSTVRGVLAAAATLLVIALAGAGSGSGTPVPVVAVGGAVSWLVATAVGLLVAGAVHRPGDARAARAALAVGSVATAAATPLVALALTLATVDDARLAAPWPAAAGAGLGWLVAASAASVTGALRLRAELLAPAPRGEPARAAASRGESLGHGRNLAGSAVGAAGFAAFVLALGVLPVLVVVLVPMHAALAALVARTRTASRTSPHPARLRA